VGDRNQLTPGGEAHSARRWAEYVAARQGAESVERTLGHAMGFGSMHPPELNSHYPGNLVGQGEGNRSCPFAPVLSGTGASVRLP
jgi:hypothetical protein